MSPFSLSDSELDEVMSLAEAIPVDHRDAFLQAVCAALAQYPEDARGPGAIHREAIRLQRFWASAPPLMRRQARGATTRYR